MEELHDVARFGILLRALRQVSGYESVSDLVDALNKSGVACGNDTIYAIEQGRQKIRLDLYHGIMMLCRPRERDAWFAPAYRGDLDEWVRREK